MIRWLVFSLQLLALTAAPASARQGTDFARLVARLSEPGGYFDSDNLVSNETSYLHVLPALRTLNVRGGAYVGVGPEQNFSYIAEIHPDVAILIDIRRDNMLLHLLLKAMFDVARNRMEYLCLLYGRPAPPDPGRWSNAPLGDILTYLEITPADSGSYRRSHAALMERVARYAVPLADSDRSTLQRFHDEFYGSGINITFTSRGRPSRPGYPTARELYLATDLDGNQVSYLASEERFRVVRDLERRDKVLPVVGDLSGTVAMHAIAKYVSDARLTVSALYVSNVEMYLFRQLGSFAQFAENVRALPAGPTSMIIRSFFGRGMRGGPGMFPDPPVLQPMAGHLSAQQLQPFATFLQLTVRPDSVNYWDILGAGSVDLRAPRPPRSRSRRQPSRPHRARVSRDRRHGG